MNSTRRLNVPKLKDSCTGCANSKVKCSRDKPTCARCLRRGLPCEYMVTKRTGRVSSTKATPVGKKTSSNAALAPMSSSISPKDHRLIFARQPACSCRPYAAPVAVMQASAALQDHALIAMDEEDFETPTPAPVQPSNGRQHHCHQHQHQHRDSSSSSSSNLWPDSSELILDEHDMWSALFTAGEPTPSPTMMTGQSDTSDLFSTPNSPEISQAAGSEQEQAGDASGMHCLQTALQLLVELSPATAFHCPSYAHGSSAGGAQASVDALIAQNRAATDSLLSMMACPCSQNDYMLTIVALVSFTIMGRYATAVTKLGNSRLPANNIWHDTRTSKSGAMATTASHSVPRSAPHKQPQYLQQPLECAHLPAQLILNEMRRLQKLVNMLSSHLNAARLHNHASSLRAPSGSNRHNRDSLPAAIAGSSVSTTSLDEIEVDLRKQLRCVSLDTIELATLSIYEES